MRARGRNAWLEVEDTEVVPADDLLLLAGLAPTVERCAGGGDPRPEGKVVALLQDTCRGGGRGGGDVHNEPRVAKVVPHVPVVPVGRRAGAAVRHGNPALIAGHALKSLVP